MSPITTLTRVMLGINAVFWIGVGAATAVGLIDFNLSSSGAFVIGALSIANGALLAFAAWRVLRGSRVVDLAALALLVVNGVLSVTDQMDPMDWVALLWNALIAGLLVGGMWLARRSRTTDQLDATEA